ncbi:hypothetical protein H2O73_04910 [Vibrio sp. 404]|uniref:Uncharacterized protein n=1 Tax=Vibrio marinisediminis TaxID=2758441 RepID=A0A7W2FP47_9VIBR|nr:hypothetical protein [Vibrio marinisediminis]
MGLEALVFVMDAFITTCCMYVASKLSYVIVDFKSLLIIALSVALVSLTPAVGWILGLLLFVYLLSKAANASFGDCIWVVVFTKVVSFVVLMALGGVFA